VLSAAVCPAKSVQSSSFGEKLTLEDRCQQHVDEILGIEIASAMKCLTGDNKDKSRLFALSLTQIRHYRPDAEELLRLCFSWLDRQS